MRTATINLDGQERLLCFSTGVVEEICEKFGGMEEYLNAISDGSELSQLRHVVWSLNRMMVAGAAYAEMKGIETAPPLTETEIRTLCDVTELLYMRSKVKETVTSGSSRQVEAAPPKNAAATSGKKKAKAH